MSETIVIVGAGLSGLSTAYHLEKHGYSPIIYEASDRCGGRIKTDHIDGFILDRGFQIILSTYKELLTVCPEKELGISYFPPGIMIQDRGGWLSLLNPLRKESWMEERSPFLFDFLKIGKLLLNPDPELNECDLATILKKIGLSLEFTQKAAIPFFSNLFIDPELNINGKTFQYMLPYFVKGRGGLPRNGMQAIPDTLASKLKNTKIIFNAKVQRLEDHSIVLESGEKISADRIVLALSKFAASTFIPSISTKNDKSLTSIYYTVKESYFTASPTIYLEPDQEKPINNFSFVNLIQSSYAPKGEMLISAIVLNKKWQLHPNLLEAATQQLSSYFRLSPHNWKHLKTYHIEHALPDQSIPPPFDGNYCFDPKKGIYLCGELVDLPTSNQSIISGANVADVIHTDITERK